MQLVQFLKTNELGLMNNTRDGKVKIKFLDIPYYFIVIEKGDFAKYWKDLGVLPPLLQELYEID